METTQEAVTPVTVKPISGTPALKKKLFPWVYLIPVCFGLPVVLSLLFPDTSEGRQMDCFILLAAGAYLLVRCFLLMIEYLRAVRLDREGITLAVPLSGHYVGKVYVKTRWGIKTHYILWLVYTLENERIFRVAVTKTFYETALQNNRLWITYLRNSPDIQRVEGASGDLVTH